MRPAELLMCLLGKTGVHLDKLFVNMNGVVHSSLLAFILIIARSLPGKTHEE